MEHDLIFKITISTDQPIYDTFSTNGIIEALRTLVGPYPSISIETLKK